MGTIIIAAISLFNKIEWIDDTTVKLKYDFGSMGIWKSEIIHLD